MVKTFCDRCQKEASPAVFEVIAKPRSHPAAQDNRELYKYWELCRACFDDMNTFVAEMQRRKG